jgi:hypothetical protein
MTAIQDTGRTVTVPATAPARTRLAVPGLIAAAAAAGATTAVAAVARAAGVSLAVDGDQIPLLGFTQLTFTFAVIGLILAAVLRRRATDPRRAFVRSTVALTAASLVPPFLIHLDAASVAVLIVAHLVAAAIVIPVVASRLRRS